MRATTRAILFCLATSSFALAQSSTPPGPAAGGATQGLDRKPARFSRWNQWRGPLGTGVAPDAKPPVEWSSTKNIRWKTELPGKGHSSPVLWDNHVFVTAAIPIGPKLSPHMSGRPGEHDNLPIDSNYQFVVIAVDRRDGTILWKTVVREEVPLEAGHMTGSLASASPVTDGEFVFAHFGAQGVYCLNLQGKLCGSAISAQCTPSTAMVTGLHPPSTANLSL